MKKTETEFGIEPESVNWQLPYMLKCHEYKNKFVFVVHNYECAYMAAINNSSNEALTIDALIMYRI